MAGHAVGDCPMRSRLKIVPIRGATFLLLGMLIGMGATPVVAALRPSATKAAVQTRAFSCPSYAWHPINSATTYAIINDTELWQTYATKGDGYFACNAVLPNHAVVTQVAFTTMDLSESFNIRYCALVRIDLGGAESSQGKYNVVAQIPPTSYGAYRRIATTDTVYNIVDNSRFGYVLQCQFTGASQNLGLYGASVWYQIAPSNG